MFQGSSTEYLVGSRLVRMHQNALNRLDPQHTLRVITPDMYTIVEDGVCNYLTKAITRLHGQGDELLQASIVVIMTLEDLQARQDHLLKDCLLVTSGQNLAHEMIRHEHLAYNHQVENDALGVYYILCNNHPSENRVIRGVLHLFHNRQKPMPPTEEELLQSMRDASVLTGYPDDLLRKAAREMWENRHSVKEYLQVLQQKSGFSEQELTSRGAFLLRTCAKCKCVGFYKKCARCAHVHYCGRKCQTEDWPEHKRMCVKK